MADDPISPGSEEDIFQFETDETFSKHPPNQSERVQEPRCESQSETTGEGQGVSKSETAGEDHQESHQNDVSASTSASVNEAGK